MEIDNMSDKLAKLLAQQKTLAAQIKAARKAQQSETRTQALKLLEAAGFLELSASELEQRIARACGSVAVAKQAEKAEA
jgi:hypothetical protein